MIKTGPLSLHSNAAPMHPDSFDIPPNIMRSWASNVNESGHSKENILPTFFRMIPLVAFSQHDVLALVRMVKANKGKDQVNIYLQNVPDDELFM